MVYIFMANGFEEIEAITVVDILKRAGIDIMMVSISNELYVKGGQGIEIKCDLLIDNIDVNSGECFIIPGGMEGVENLKINKNLKEILLQANNDEKIIAAICAGPIVINTFGLLKDKHITCYPGIEDELDNIKVVNNKKVVKDKNIITSKGPGTSNNFALEIVKNIKGKEIANKLNEEMLFKRKYEVIVKELI